MPPRSPIVEARRLGQRRVRLHADREDHDVRRIRLAGLGLDLDRATVQLLEADHAVVGDHLHAMPLDVTLDEARDLRVQRAEDMIGLLDEGHVEPGWTRFSAVSRPMNPPPTTTARRTGLTI